MVRKRWTPYEISILRKLAKEGLTIQEIFETGELPGRSIRSIETQCGRLSYAAQKKFYAPHVNAQEIAELDEIVKRYAAAFRQICEEREFIKQEIERSKVIFQAATKYRGLFLAYAEVKRVDDRLEEIEKMVKTLQGRFRLEKLRRLETDLEKVQTLVAEAVVEASDDPVEFFEAVMGFKPTKYQLDLIEKFKDNQFIAARWCRQSGKSWIIAALLLWYAIVHDDPNLHLGHWTVETLERYYGKMDRKTVFESGRKYLPNI